MGQPGTREGGRTARGFFVRERVRWSDVDPSGNILWSAYTRLVEMAETEMFRAAGFPYGALWDRLDIWLPRVQFHIDYRSPVGLDDLLDIEIVIAHVGRSSLRLAFSMRKADGGLAAEGALVIVAIGRTDGKAVDVPASLVQALAPYTAAQKI